MGENSRLRGSQGIWVLLLTTHWSHSAKYSHKPKGNPRVWAGCYWSHANLQQKELFWLTFFGPEMVSDTAREEAAPQKPQNVTAGSLWGLCLGWGRELVWVGRGNTFPCIVLALPTCIGVPGHRWVPGSGVISSRVSCFVPAEWAFMHLRIVQWLLSFHAYSSPLPVQRDSETSSLKNQAHHESITDVFSIDAVLGR